MDHTTDQHIDLDGIRLMDFPMDQDIDLDETEDDVLDGDSLMDFAMDQDIGFDATEDDEASMNSGIANMNSVDIDAAWILTKMRNPPVSWLRSDPLLSHAGKSFSSADSQRVDHADDGIPWLHSKLLDSANSDASLFVSQLTPSFVQGHSQQPSHQAKRPFGLLAAFLQHDDLLLYLTTQCMEPRELISLYCISKPFHYLVNSHLTTYVLSSARRWARLTHFRPCNADLPRAMLGQKVSGKQACGTEPTTAGITSPYDITTILPFHLFVDLCIPDPTRRTLDDGATKYDGQKSASYADQPIPVEKRRHVPTFRYLRFLLFRAKTIHSITSQLLAAGHRLPIPQTAAVIAKIWLLMDIPFNINRRRMMKSKDVWTNQDLYIAQLFFVKLDMCFSDAVDSTGEMALRKMLLAQRTLSVLDKVLRREDGRDILEILRLWARVKYRPSKEHRDAGLTVLGIPPRELGMLGVEFWGCPIKPGNPLNIPVDPYARDRLLRPDRLVMAEAILRKLPLQYKVLDMVAYGYIDRYTGINLPRSADPRKNWLREEKARGFARAAAGQHDDDTDDEDDEDDDMSEDNDVAENGGDIEMGGT